MVDIEYILVDGVMFMLFVCFVVLNWFFDVFKVREIWCGGKSWKYGRSKIILF